MGSGLQCRLWWPRHLSYRPSRYMTLLGWVSGTSGSVDLVVATALCNAVNPCDSFTQAMLRCATSRLPSELQGRATFSVIGQCLTASIPCQDEIIGDKLDELSSGLVRFEHADYENNRLANGNFMEEPGCSRDRGDHFFTRNRYEGSHAVRNGFRVIKGTRYDSVCPPFVVLDTWVELSMQRSSISGIDWLPEIHRLRFQGSIWVPNFHLVLYDQPKLASHHFSIQPWRFLSPTGRPDDTIAPHFLCDQQPEWVKELVKHHEAPDIDLVVLQLNCADAAEQAIKRLLASLDTPCKRLSFASIAYYTFRHLFAATVALVATIFYVFVQAASYLLNTWAFVHLDMISRKLLRHTYRNIRIRCYELTGWPVILLWRGCGRDQPNIAAAHKTALVRHSTWSAIIFDLAFGIVAGIFFFHHQLFIIQTIRSMVRSLTDDILRTGCIWLMGVPAGFKLNTELAGTLGLISLNVIQVWSTLLYFLKPMLGPVLSVLAVLGMSMGITVPAAMIADVLFLATFHISTLHQVVSFLYSNQLQSLAALWRLFRGRKRNTLRGRIDTYDYSVEQHVVGSLMFTPLLLLLPTTSVFYIFLTMLYTSLSLLRFSLQVFVAFLHCFPYAQVAIWCVQPRRFPSGVWFQNIPAVGAYYAVKRQNETDVDCVHSRQSLVSFLGVKTANLGEMLLPYLKQLCDGFSCSCCALFIYKIFSGERWPSSMELGDPALPPWMALTVKRFWWLCYDAVLASI